MNNLKKAGFAGVAAAIALPLAALGVPAHAGGDNAAAAVGNYDVRGYSNIVCEETGYTRLVVGAGHKYGIRSIKVNANGWFQTNVPGKTGRYSYKANTCLQVNSYGEWSDTHIAGMELP